MYGRLRPGSNLGPAGASITLIRNPEPPSDGVITAWIERIRQEAREFGGREVDDEVEVDNETMENAAKMARMEGESLTWAEAMNARAWLLGRYPGQLEDLTILGALDGFHYTIVSPVTDGIWSDPETIRVEFAPRVTQDYPFSFVSCLLVSTKG